MSDRSTSRMGGDLGLLAVGTILAGALLAGPDIWRPLEIVAGVGLLVVFPGYALVSLSFPARPNSGGRSQDSSPKLTVGWPARIGLTVLLSGLVVAVTALVLSWTVGIRLVPAVSLITGTSLIVTGLALVRRRQLPPKERVQLPPIADTVRGIRTSKGRPAALMLALVVLAATVVVVGVAPVGGESYTEVSLLSESENGTLVAEGYPETVSTGGSIPVTVELKNHEFRTVEYDLVTVAEPINADGSVGDPIRVDTFERELAHGEELVVERSASVPDRGDQVRISVLVFEGEATESLADPDHRVQFLVTVT